MDCQIAHFASKYTDISRDLFVDPASGKLIHPGEFGTYREEVLRRLLRLILPSSFGVGQGFIINRHGKISRQCDVIVYDKLKTPTFCSLENQRFVPIETVAVVIEAKSILSRGLLSDATEHLVQLKQMRDEVVSEKIAKDGESRRLLIDQIGTFIICEAYDSTIETLLTNFDALIKSVPPFYAPNLVLNIERGGICYSDSKSMFWPFPIDAEDTGWLKDELLPLRIIKSEGSKFNHIKLFLRYISLFCEKVITVQPDLTEYFSFEEIK